MKMPMRSGFDKDESRDVRAASWDKASAPKPLLPMPDIDRTYTNEAFPAVTMTAQDIRHAPRGGKPLNIQPPIDQESSQLLRRPQKIFSFAIQCLVLRLISVSVPGNVSQTIT